MKTAGRKAALAAYKEIKPQAGVYAYTCAPSGAVWVGSAPNLAQIVNRIQFDLDLGKHRNAALQAAWNAHGKDAFQFKALETIDDDTPDYLRAQTLKARLAHWREALDAQLL